MSLACVSCGAKVEPDLFSRFVLGRCPSCGVLAVSHGGATRWYVPIDLEAATRNAKLRSARAALLYALQSRGLASRGETRVAVVLARVARELVAIVEASP